MQWWVQGDDGGDDNDVEAISEREITWTIAIAFDAVIYYVRFSSNLNCCRVFAIVVSSQTQKFIKFYM